MEKGPRFLSLSTNGILGDSILYYGGCPVYYRMFNSTPGLYPLDDSSIPAVVATKIVLDIAKRSGEGAKLSLVKNHWAKGSCFPVSCEVAKK